MEQGGKPQYDGGAEDARWTHEEGEQPDDAPIHGAPVGRTLAAAIMDQQSMPDQCGFGNNGTESPGPTSRTTLTIK